MLMFVLLYRRICQTAHLSLSLSLIYKFYLLGICLNEGQIILFGGDFMMLGFIFIKKIKNLYRILYRVGQLIHDPINYYHFPIVLRSRDGAEILDVQCNIVLFFYNIIFTI